MFGEDVSCGESTLWLHDWTVESAELWTPIRKLWITEDKQPILLTLHATLVAGVLVWVVAPPPTSAFPSRVVALGAHVASRLSHSGSEFDLLTGGQVPGSEALAPQA